MLYVFNLYGEYLMKEALTEVGDFSFRGRIIKVRFAEDIAIIAKSHEVLQDMVKRWLTLVRSMVWKSTWANHK